MHRTTTVQIVGALSVLAIYLIVVSRGGVLPF